MYHSHTLNTLYIIAFKQNVHGGGQQIIITLHLVHYFFFTDFDGGFVTQRLMMKVLLFVISFTAETPPTE